MSVTKLAINTIIYASITVAPFEVLYDKSIPLRVDLLLSRKSYINPHVHKFARNMKQLIKKITSAMHEEI